MSREIEGGTIRCVVKGNEVDISHWTPIPHSNVYGMSCVDPVHLKDDGTA